MANSRSSLSSQPVRVLLVEDDAGDMRLTIEALKNSKLFTQLAIVRDGVEAMASLRANNPPPDLILLDLNMPKMDGREVLAAIKGDAKLKQIPVIILTTSSAEEDIVQSYDAGANCYIIKPADLPHFRRIVQSIEDFWLTVAKLPSRIINK
jgi:chemotaxis family two-component system response regulator Rcp1